MRHLVRIVTMLLLLTLAAQAQDTVKIGSKIFPESRILGEMMAQIIEANTDLKVERKLGLGATLVCFQATVSGELDIYPEYTGTGVINILKLPGDFRDPLRTYMTARKLFNSEYDLEWLTPFGFNNTYVMAVSPEFAKEHKLRKVSDLKRVEKLVRPGMNHEFLKRPDGYPGLAELYDLDISQNMGMEHGLAYQAIANGKINLVNAYSTDGELRRYKLVSLEDNLNYFPPYHAAPVVRGELLRRHPEVGKALELLGFQLNDQSMQELNYQVQEKRRPIPEVVSEFLISKNLIESDGLVGGKSTSTQARGSFLDFFLSRTPQTLKLTRRHLYLTAVSLFLAISVGVPIGIVITRTPRLAQPVLGLAGVIQTIPSIALLAFMIPIPSLGLGSRSAIVALFLYALLPIIRNTFTGIKEVDPGLLEAARGMGLTDRQLLTVVELPLAIRTIMAGIRTSAVINIGVATLAAFIGAGGLGDPIVTGLQLNDSDLVLAGAIPAALLAIAVDQGLGLVEKLLAPKGVDE